MEGMVVDYDEIDGGEGYSFIFMNPNDPNYVVPEQGDAPKKN